MAIKGKDELFLNCERPGYETTRKRNPKQGWDSMTQVSTYNRMFDGMQARPYTSQLAGSPKSRAKSGPRSIANWQRDYNSKGLCDEKVSTLRFERIVQMKKEALKESERRNIPVEVIEEEMYQALRARSTRIDTGLRKDEMNAPCRTYPSDGGPPRLFDGLDKLEEKFCFRDARDMFRGEAWESMTMTLGKLDEFNPQPRELLEAKQMAERQARGSFSVAVTPAAASEAKQKALKKAKDPKALGSADLESLKKLLVRKYGTVSAAWRHCLDQDGNGKLSFAEWSKALRAVGYEGNIKATYKELDDDNSGIVTFGELEPELAERMKDFKLKFFAKYGENWEVAWKAIDENGNNQLDREEFGVICENIGYEGKAAEMFKELRYDKSRKFLNLEDFKSMPKTF